jgi:hypothetical protein
MGPGLADRCEGSSEAKRRLRAILETLGGDKSVGKACEELGIGEARFHELRAQALQAAVAGLEPGAAGRPRREEPEESARVAALLEERKRLLFELQVSRTREEIAVALPRVQVKPAQDEASARAEKKTARAPSIITNRAS